MVPELIRDHLFLSDKSIGTLRVQRHPILDPSRMTKPKQLVLVQMPNKWAFDSVTNAEILHRLELCSEQFDLT